MGSKRMGSEWIEEATFLNSGERAKFDVSRQINPSTENTMFIKISPTMAISINQMPGRLHEAVTFWKNIEGVYRNLGVVTLSIEDRAQTVHWSLYADSPMSFWQKAADFLVGQLERKADLNRDGKTTGSSIELISKFPKEEEE